MSILLIFPGFLGFLAGLLINYLSDVLPDSLHLGIPECQNQSCKNPYLWKDYLLFTRCRKCDRRRSLRTFLILALAISASLYVWFISPDRLGFALGMLMLAYLFLIAVIDFEHRLVLRTLSMAGFFLASLTGYLMHGWPSTIIGSVFGFSVMFIVYLFGTRVTRWIARKHNQQPGEVEEAFGSGDVTLAVILGLFLGWPRIWYGLLLGVSVLGIVVIPLAFILLFKRRVYRQELVYFPIGVPFILSTILLMYLPSLFSGLLPGY
jgi:prepilin signal peptidase PulO-like enzyme (type II secretory pathway)